MPYGFCNVWWPLAPRLVAKMTQKVVAKACQRNLKKSGHYKPYVQTTLKHILFFNAFGVSQGLQKSTTDEKKLTFVAEPVFQECSLFMSQEMLHFQKTLNKHRLFGFSGLGLLIQRVNKGS